MTESKEQDEIIKEISRPPLDIQIQIHDKVCPVLDLVDNLRKVGIERDVPIPQIAVMGDQSGGKSSVLEAITGDDEIFKNRIFVKACRSLEGKV